MKLLTSILALALCVPFARAQDESREEVELRVTGNRPRAAVVDRGSADGLAVGDRVELYPREVGVMFGRVTRVGERTALVELDDALFVPAPGTRGMVLIPSARLDALAAAGVVAARPPPQVEAPVGAEAPQVQSETSEEQSAAEGEHEAWERKDDWTQGMPLLARVRAVKPDERAPEVHGTVYLALEHTWASENDAIYGFDRIGTALDFENPFGKGGRLQFAGELNWRQVDITDGDDFTSTHLRLDRLAYTIGGNRFESTRWGVGRFLQYAVPEFGVLDGAEWGHRFEGGDSLSASIGFMPEPDAEYETWDDFQVATSYRWVADESERLAISGAYQKSFHNGNADRDLFVFDLAYLPRDTWTLVGTAWIDYYTTGDQAKGSGFEVTQAWLTTARRWSGGSTLEFAYRHQAFPEIDRNAFTPVTFAQLADDHWDRISGRAYSVMNDTLALNTQAAGWVDEDEQGGDFDVGVELRELFFEDSILEITGFSTRGATSSVFGGRASLGQQSERGAWFVEYELTNTDIDNFTPANDDIPQHRLHLAFDRYTESGWTFSLDIVGLSYDDEGAFSLGIFVQRSF